MSTLKLYRLPSQSHLQASSLVHQCDKENEHPVYSSKAHATKTAEYKRALSALRGFVSNNFQLEHVCIGLIIVYRVRKTAMRSFILKER